VARDAEMVDIKMLGQGKNVTGPVLKSAISLKTGPAKAGPVRCDQSKSNSLRSLIGEPCFNATAWRPVEIENRKAVRCAIFREGKSAAIL
jgi:hypothetical protein